MATLDSDKRGYYVVGWKKFYNKVEALKYSTQMGFEVRWVFNDAVYSKIDWTIPIPKTLKELYRDRAQQLRDSYDHIVLHYSGGQDSNNMLHSFIDNNIHLDQIIIQVPKPMLKHIKAKDDTDFSNHWAEFEYQAIPYLKKHEHQLRNTTITVQDMSVATLDTFKHDNWTEIIQPGASYNLGVISRAMCQFNDVEILKVSEKGKRSCQLLGIDKPLVHYDGTGYYCTFADQSAYHIEPRDYTLKDLFDISVTEFFYWTPDMPEIVVKQAQEIKAACESNILVQNLFNKTLKQEVGIFRDVMQSIIYDPTHRPDFQTGKPGQNVGRILNRWFYEGVGGDLLHNYEYAIDMMGKGIDEKYFNSKIHTHGFSSIHSKFYKL
jgi:hypothetical protein